MANKYLREVERIEIDCEFTDDGQALVDPIMATIMRVEERLALVATLHRCVWFAAFGMFVWYEAGKDVPLLPWMKIWISAAVLFFLLGSWFRRLVFQQFRFELEHQLSDDQDLFFALKRMDSGATRLLEEALALPPSFTDDRESSMLGVR